MRDRAAPSIVPLVTVASGKYRTLTLDRLDDASLLSLRFRDIQLPLHSGMAARHMQRLYGELRARGIRFRPHFWFAEEWFSPDGVPGIALPFYLAQPRLMRLERRFMHQVEGGNSRWLMSILRHEAGHALDTAYGLRQRKDWCAVFGNGIARYPHDYQPRPASRQYVLHLGHWYAQSHPTEDFAETFAVWLQPRARWRRDYAGWPALRKLEYVDALMAEIVGKPAVARSRRQVDPVAGSARTLREHYRRKARRYLVEDGQHDPALRRIFSVAADRRHPGAAGYLRSIVGQVERALVRRAQLHPYVVEHAMDSLIHRCGELHLQLRHDRPRTRREFARLVQRVAKEILKRNRENYAL